MPNTLIRPGSATDVAGHTRVAVERLSPRWTMWTLHMLREGRRTSGQIAKAMPWISQPTVSLRMKAMAARNRALIAPVPNAPRGTYALTRRGANLGPVQRALAEWAQEHLREVEPTPAAEYEEIALRVLRPAHAAAILHLMRDGHPRTSGEIDTVLPDGLSATAVHAALTQMLNSTIVARSHARIHALYTLTDRGHELAAVADTLAAWAGHTSDGIPDPRPIPASARSRTQLPIPAVVFSHPDAATPTGPVVAASRPLSHR